MNKIKMLVLGGTGFIGQNILNYYFNNDLYEIHSTYFNNPKIEIPNVTWHKVDLRVESQVHDLIRDQDIVIQCAATTSGIAEIVSKVDYHITDNVIMNANILRRVNQIEIKHFIFFSCITMLQSSLIPQKESDFNEADTMHPRYFGIGWTKVYIEKMCEYYSRQSSKTKYSVIRHSNVFGPHDKFNLKNSHVLGATITKVLTSEKTIEIWGTGEEYRDLIYIKDLVGFVEKLIDRQTSPFLLLNCGGTAFISIAHLTEKIITLSGRKDLEVVFNPTGPTVDFSACVDIELAKHKIGWAPSTSFDTALRETIEHWEIKKKQNSTWPDL
jgi:nucleoside-diphosphate-sugar epimerase